MSTPMTHSSASLPDIFLTFPVPAAPCGLTSLCTFKPGLPHYSRSGTGTWFKGHRPSVGGFVHSHFLSAVYRDSEQSLWEQSLPHSRLHSTHIPVALSEKSNSVPLTRMLQWSCRGERRGMQGSLSVC